MPRPKILLQLDADPQPSVFDAVVAIDAGVDQLLPYGGVTPEQVQSLVHGAMFTRGGGDLRSTAIFVGGSDVAAAEELFARVGQTFFGPARVSAMLDANGCNTTAAAAVIAAARHLPLTGTAALVLAGTGPVGQRVAHLLGRERANVRVGSRSRDKASLVVDALRGSVPEGQFAAVATGTPDQLREALQDVRVVIAAGAAGVELLGSDTLSSANSLHTAIDLNAVPPAGIAGISAMDKAAEHDGVICYGAIGVGGTKMKIHHAAVEKLFSANDLLLDADEILALGKEIESTG